MAIMTYAKKLVQVRAIYRDMSASFRKYKKAVSHSIDVSIEITDHMKEWVAEHDLHNEDIARTLERLSRECKIYISRLKHLDQSLQKCRQVIQKEAKTFAASKDGKVRQAKLNKCNNSLLRWSHLRRDFHKCFLQATGDWTKAEEAIFALE